MTRDVLDTESIESGGYGYDRHPIDLAEEISTAVDAFDTGSAAPVTVTLPAAPASTPTRWSGSSTSSFAGGQAR